MKKRVFAAAMVGVVMALASPAWAGPLVFRPPSFVRQAGPPRTEVVAFEIASPSGTYMLHVQSGDDQGAHVVTSAVIRLNGVTVATPNDFKPDVFGFWRDVTLVERNELEVEVRGAPDSILTVEIREANPNPGVTNARGDLDGQNMRHQIVLWWSRDPRAEEYVVLRSHSADGPWEEAFRHDAATAGESGAAVDTTPEAQTTQLCYRMEVLAGGHVVRRYEPICVPAYKEAR